MVIQLKFIGHLREYLPDTIFPVDLEVAPNSTVGEVFDGLGLPRDKPRIILVNQLRTDLDRVLDDGDTLVALSLVGGG